MNEHYIKILRECNEDSAEAFIDAVIAIWTFQKEMEKEREAFKKDPMLDHAWSTRGKV